MAARRRSPYPPSNSRNRGSAASWRRPTQRCRRELALLAPQGSRPSNPHPRPRARLRVHLLQVIPRCIPPPDAYPPAQRAPQRGHMGIQGLRRHRRARTPGHVRQLIVRDDPALLPRPMGQPRVFRRRQRPPAFVPPDLAQPVVQDHAGREHGEAGSDRARPPRPWRGPSAGCPDRPSLSADCAGHRTRPVAPAEAARADGLVDQVLAPARGDPAADPTDVPA